jgi:predicted transposase/invertase (TIGR01784 family)
MKRLNPLNDFLFQKYLGEKGDEEQLLSLLNAILARTNKNNLEKVEIIENKTLTPDIVGNKTSILDVRSITGDGTKVNIELQLRNLYNMDKRSLFYWSREYSKGILAGQDYKELPNVIAINIVNYECINMDDFHSTFHLWEDRQKEYMLTDALEIHFIDMVRYKKLREKDIRNNPLHRWLTFFDKDTPEDIIKEVLDMDTTIQKANDKMNFLASDAETLRLYEMREMALSDYTSAINMAKLEGKQEREIEIARELMQEGFSVEIIKKLTGLDESQVAKLLE